MKYSDIGVELLLKYWNWLSKTVFLPILRIYRKKYHNELTSLCLITSNCIGGVLSNAYGLRFQSPTVNLYMNAADYISFVENLELNLHTPITYGGTSVHGYPIGKIGNITIHFVHYDSFEDAKTKWEERAGRVDLSHVLLIMCERDGCTSETVRQFFHLPYPKLFLSLNAYPYSFCFTVHATQWEKKHNINPIDRLMMFGSCGKRRFERYITTEVLTVLAGEGHNS